MNQDVQTKLKALIEAIANSAPHVQAQPPSEAQQLADLRTANTMLRMRLAEQEQIVARERARADVTTAEAALLCQALMNIRKDVHFANRTVNSAGKWETLCEEIMQQVDEVTPNGIAGVEMLRDYRHVCEIVRDLENKMAPVNEYVVELERRHQATRAALAQLVAAVMNAGSHFPSDLPAAMQAARAALNQEDDNG